jgi:hypothetical protein
MEKPIIDTEPEKSTRRKRLFNWVNSNPKKSILITFFLFVFMLWLPSDKSNDVSSVNSSNDTNSSTSVYARAACGDFAKLYRDIEAGIITDAEMREQAKKIYDRARYTNLEKTAEGLLSAITRDDVDSLKVYYASMIVLCGDILK